MQSMHSKSAFISFVWLTGRIGYISTLLPGSADNFFFLILQEMGIEDLSGFHLTEHTTVYTDIEL